MTDSDRIDTGAPTTEHPHDPRYSKNPFQGRMPSFNLGQRFSSPFARCVFVGVITLFLLIPLGLVRDVVYDRMYLHSEATNNITRSWGKTQTVSGPALIIPYRIWEDRKEIVKVMVNNKEVPQEVVTREYHTRHKVVLPSSLTFDTEMNPEIRYRGIYKQALYTAPVDVAGSFILPAEEAFHSNMTHIYWDSA